MIPTVSVAYRTRLVGLMIIFKENSSIINPSYLCEGAQNQSRRKYVATQ